MTIKEDDITNLFLSDNDKAIPVDNNAPIVNYEDGQGWDFWVATDDNQQKHMFHSTAVPGSRVSLSFSGTLYFIYLSFIICLPLTLGMNFRYSNICFWFSTSRRGTGIRGL